MKTPHTDSYIRLQNERGYNVSTEDAAHMRKLETLHNDVFDRWKTCSAARGRIVDERNAAVETLVRKQENNFGLDRRNKRLAKALEDVAVHDGPGFPPGTCAKIARRALDSQNVKSVPPADEKTPPTKSDVYEPTD